jgi:hypothetical protein
MAGPEQRRIPEWARKERVEDLAWLQENLHVLWPGAQRSYDKVGRGAIVIDTSITVTHEAGRGNPMFYMNEAQIEELNEPDALRMVRGYDPSWEVVTMLLKKDQKVSTYRIGVPAARERSPK